MSLNAVHGSVRCRTYRFEAKKTAAEFSGGNTGQGGTVTKQLSIESQGQLIVRIDVVLCPGAHSRKKCCRQRFPQAKKTAAGYSDGWKGQAK